MSISRNRAVYALLALAVIGLGADVECMRGSGHKAARPDCANKRFMEDPSNPT
jgi:hypothetical protein